MVYATAFWNEIRTIMGNLHFVLQEAFKALQENYYGRPTQYLAHANAFKLAESERQESESTEHAFWRLVGEGRIWVTAE